MNIGQRWRHPLTEQILSKAEHNLVIHCHNHYTLRVYRLRVNQFLKYNQVESYDDLLFNGDMKLIQDRLETFLYHIQNPEYHLSSSSVILSFRAIKFFYTMNDILLNWRRIAKVLPRPRKAVNDRAYTREEIARIVEKVDQRGRCIVLLMCSSAMRIGAISGLNLADLHQLGEIKAITVYKNDPEEYTALCSPECAKAIDEYLDY